jgi:hypothetical protein
MYSNAVERPPCGIRVHVICSAWHGVLKDLTHVISQDSKTCWLFTRGPNVVHTSTPRELPVNLSWPLNMP